MAADAKKRTTASVDMVLTIWHGFQMLLVLSKMLMKSGPLLPKAQDGK